MRDGLSGPAYKWNAYERNPQCRKTAMRPAQDLVSVKGEAPARDGMASKEWNTRVLVVRGADKVRKADNNGWKIKVQGWCRDNMVAQNSCLLERGWRNEHPKRNNADYREAGRKELFRRVELQ